jgi:hypothetical protein
VVGGVEVRSRVSDRGREVEDRENRGFGVVRRI